MGERAFDFFVNLTPCLCFQGYPSTIVSRYYDRCSSDDFFIRGQTTPITETECSDKLCIWYFTTYTNDTKIVTAGSKLTKQSGVTI